MDVIGTLMTALKAAVGQPSEGHTAAMFPLIPDVAGTGHFYITTMLAKTVRVNSILGIQFSSTNVSG